MTFSKSYQQLANNSKEGKIRRMSGASFAKEGFLLAEESKLLFRAYLGVESPSTSASFMPAPTPASLPSLANLGAMDWTWVQKASKKSVIVFSTMTPGSNWQAVKAVTSMQAKKRDILNLLLDDNRIGEFDDMFERFEFLCRVDERTSVRRMIFKAIWPTSARDFVISTTWDELQDGSLCVASKSAPETLCPPEKGYVRGCVLITGYYIQPYESLTAADIAATCPQIQPGGCKVTFCVHTELGGSLPPQIINMLSTAAPLKILGAVDKIVSK